MKVIAENVLYVLRQQNIFGRNNTHLENKDLGIKLIIFVYLLLKHRKNKIKVTNKKFYFI